MRGILLFFVVVSSVYGAQETLSDLYELLKDPSVLSELEKRLGSDFDVDDDLFSDVDGCYDTSGLASADCNFYANGSAIIKTSESIGRGAEFLKEYLNISCPRDCTALCCEFPNCDTSVYQDKGEHKCYLFHCGDQSNCVFTQHNDYWTGSISKETHTSHSFAPGGATYSHENELENLGSPNEELPTPSVIPSRPPTTVRTTTTTVATTRITTPPLYGLKKYCPSYGSTCEDPHAVCLMKSCRCSVGYHEKNGTCRKHCRRDEYECEGYSYYSENARECIPVQLVCDGNPDCMDASDESNCQDKSKQAYLDGDTGGSSYNSPFISSKFNQDQDSQYQYGFPIPGLNSQQGSGLYPTANQIYPSQVAANQNAAGQYYVPVLANQNQGNLNLANQANPLNQPWPLGGEIGSQVPVYQNNVPVQYPAQQQQYLGQPGYIQNPVQQVQPVQPVQNVLQTLQGLQVPQNQVPVVANQKPAVVNSLVTSGPVQHISNTNQAAVVPKQTNNDNDDTGYAMDRQDEAGTQKQVGTNSGMPLNQKEHVNTDIDDRYNKQALDRQTPPSRNYDYHQTQVDNRKPDFDTEDLVNHRHSSEDTDDYDTVRTYPPATKTKTQIGSPTQSTVSGQKSSHAHSEGFPDYPWMSSYDSNSPRVSGKKGMTLDIGSQGSTGKSVDAGRRKKPGNEEKGLNSLNPPVEKVKDVKPVDSKPNKKPTPGAQFDNQFDYDRYDSDNRYPDDYRNYDDYRRPANNKPRPSYDRYNNRYDGTRRRPSPGQAGSRYPYYPDSAGYPRGRDRYPVWDPYKDEYYYPDEYEDRRGDFDFHGKTDDNKPPLRKPGNDKGGNRNNPMGPGPHPDRVKPVNQPLSTIKQHVSTDVPTTPVPTQATQTVRPVALTDAPILTPDSQPTIKDDNADIEPVSKEDDKSSDNQLTDTSGSENSSHTASVEEKTQTKTPSSKKFNILNAESVEVTSYTDSFQGPIVALALGLAITLILLIFVGCRLRTVKRRLRKGRALHSNEADYLINGMYL